LIYCIVNNLQLAEQKISSIILSFSLFELYSANGISLAMKNKEKVIWNFLKQVVEWTGFEVLIESMSTEICFTVLVHLSMTAYCSV